MRILHLLDAASPQARGTTLAFIATSFGRLGHIEQHALLLGPASLRRAAIACGLGPDNVVSRPVLGGSAVLGALTARLAIRDLGAFDAVHCWSLGTFTLASLLMRRLPRLLTLTLTPTQRECHWLRMVISETPSEQGGATVLPISSTIRRVLLSAGVAEACVHVLRPGIDMSKIVTASRDALRKKWGVDRPNHHAAALLGDPPEATDALTALMGVGLAEEGYRRGDIPYSKIIGHPDQLNRARTETFERGLNKAPRLVQEPLITRPWEMLAACDYALALGPHAGGLSLLWAMAANVPIIGHATYAVSEIVEDHHSALLVKVGEPRMISHRVCELIADKHLAWKLRDSARHEAYSFFSRQRYCQSLQRVYEQTIERRPIEIPAMEATGGLRFTGRA